MRKVTILAAFFIISTLAFSATKANEIISMLNNYDEEITQENLQKFQKEVTECAAYFALLRESMGKIEYEINFEQVEQIISELELAMFFTAEHMGKSQSFAVNRYQHILRKMVLDMDGNYYNIVNHIEKYDQACEEMAFNPKNRIMYRSE